MIERTYVAMDVHQNFIVSVWRSRSRKERKIVVEANRGGLERLKQAVGDGAIWAAYEASSCGWEVYDELTKLGWRVSVLAPTHIAKSVRGVKRKTDLEDARRILEVLMAHGELGTKLPAVWIPGPKVREDRELVRRRLTVAEKLGQVKAEIRSLLRMHQVKAPEELKETWTLKHRAWLKGLCAAESPIKGAVRLALASQIRELDFFSEEVEQLQEAVEALSEQEAYRKPVERMTQVVGVGRLTAMTFYLELGDPTRFRNRQQVGSYLGLVPTSDESGEAADRKGHINRMGPSRIRKVLNQATLARIRCDEEFRRRYQPLAYRRGAKKAIVAMMRKLGIELWRQAVAA